MFYFNKLPNQLEPGDVIRRDGVTYNIMEIFTTLKGQKRLVVEPWCMRTFFMIKGYTFFDGFTLLTPGALFRSYLAKKVIKVAEQSCIFNYAIGERVIKNTGSYTATGTVVGRFYSTYHSSCYYVVSFDKPEGLLHIFSAKQINQVTEDA